LKCIRVMMAYSLPFDFVESFCFFSKFLRMSSRILGVHRSLEAVSQDSVYNSKYTCGEDITTLLDEVLNNSVRSVFIFDDFQNSFTDVELYSLSLVLKYNVTLAAITLSGCDIGEEAVEMFCEALLRTNVQYLDFTNTPIDDTVAKAIGSLVRLNPSVRTVVVDDTLLSEDMMDEIDAACQFNETNFGPPPIVPIDLNRMRYCARHLVGACMNGDSCPFSHGPVVRYIASHEKDLSERELEWGRQILDVEPHLPVQPPAQGDAPAFNFRRQPRSKRGDPPRSASPTSVAAPTTAVSPIVPPAPVPVPSTAYVAVALATVALLTAVLAWRRR